MWQMAIPKLFGSAMNVMSARSQYKHTKSIGDTNQKLAKIKADEIRRNAKGRLATAADTAQEIQRQARVAESDAISAMAAGGTVTDPEMLARLKLRSDQNSAAAILQGSREYQGIINQASGIELGAYMDRVQADGQAKVQYYGAISNLMLDVTKTAADYYSPTKVKGKYGGRKSNDMYGGYSGSYGSDAR